MDFYFRVNVRKMEELRAKIGAIFPEIARAAGDDVGRIMQEYAVALSRERISPSEEESFVDRWLYDVDVDSTRVHVNLTNYSDYAKYVEEGRPPGKMPPYEGFLRYALSRGIVGNATDAAGIRSEDRGIFAMRAKIGRDGTPPKWILRDVELRFPANVRNGYLWRAIKRRLREAT
jgi:hypothetical protein